MALHTNGAAGLSGLDASQWINLCTNFRKPSKDLCNALAALARRIAMRIVHPQGISSLSLNAL